MSRFAPLLLVLALLAGCTGSPDTRGPFPAGNDLVGAAASTFAAVRSVHFVMGVNGVLPGFPLRQMEGDATLDDGGYAKGTADVQVGADHEKAGFVLRGDTVDGAKVPGEYTVGALLGPDAGLHRALLGVTDAETEGRESVEGIDSLRVAGRIPAAVAASVLPAIHDDVIVKVWVSVAEPRQFVRFWVQVPPAGPHLSPVMFELALTQPDVPVPVS